ncbi:hypothetical protein BKP35_18300 [Anaerobacillus arseniciselenatis]|uniref:Uncharacterized protein n=1 Tax=Anaerobacillus arseniciselenatis TaxID=85682 RepID=A0A1S2L577_9BACI|nr:hypothetical protein [Anaerobacillus arseniciselenatis]OIJ07638.1 hypothetical protein BKP35_18300 [Anaerobacillus arseniciselenatis]
MGFLSQVKAKGKQYIYLSEYIGSSNFSGSTEINVYGFGPKEEALKRMKRWEENFAYEFPKELLNRGYGRHDLRHWIKTLETGRSKTGRSLKFS